MKKYLFSLIFLVCSLLSVQASDFLINSYRFVVAGGTPATITFLQCTNDVSDTNSYSLASQNTGTATADRHTLIALALGDSLPTFTIDSLTIGGDAATELMDPGGVASQTINYAWYIMANPSGTSETIAFTLSESILRVRVCVWQVNNLVSPALVDSAAVIGTAGAVIDLDLDTSADGIAAGMCLVASNAPTMTWTGMTERADGGTGEALMSSVADFDEDGSASVPLDVSCDSSGAQDYVGSSISLR